MQPIICLEWRVPRKSQVKNKNEDLSLAEKNVGERLSYALVNGLNQYIVEDAEAARIEFGDPLKVIEEPLMAWHEYGGRFIW